jgi:biopolymer transport protein TolR
MNVSEKVAVRSEINVTPLVDVCLVLLIIFMVVTPLLTKEVDVQLPRTPGPPHIKEVQRQVEVSIQESGAIQVNGQPVARELLTSTLAAMHAASPDRPVVVQGDRRLRYGEVRLVLELIQKAGFRKVGLIAEGERV